MLPVAAQFWAQQLSYSDMLSHLFRRTSAQFHAHFCHGLSPLSAVMLSNSCTVFRLWTAPSAPPACRNKSKKKGRCGSQSDQLICLRQWGHYMRC